MTKRPDPYAGEGEEGPGNGDPASSTMKELPTFTVVRRARLRKRIHLQRDEAGQLEVGAPRHWSEREIHAVLRQNADRVWRFLERGGRRRPAPLAYVTGARHHFLGEGCRLVVLPGRRRRSRVECEAGELRVEINRPDPQAVKNGLYRWYREQAKHVFASRLEAIAGRAEWTRGRPVRFEVRKMRRTWGNCSSAGLVRLNTHLVKAPPALIDSVIAHELCHLVEMHHGPSFYRLLAGLNPDWRSDRARLRELGASYLLE